jgi:hypothetical protein
MTTWWKRIGAATALAVVVSVVTTLVSKRSWGWDFALQCVLYTVLYAFLISVVARSRRRAEERDAQHRREVREMRRGRR